MIMMKGGFWGPFWRTERTYTHPVHRSVQPTDGDLCWGFLRGIGLNTVGGAQGGIVSRQRVGILTMGVAQTTSTYVSYRVIFILYHNLTQSS